MSNFTLRLRPIRLLYIVLLCMVAFHICGLEGMLLIVLASIDITT